MPHLVGSHIEFNYVDKRKVQDRGVANPNTRVSEQVANTFTANAGGTTTTLVGANATVATGVNVIRPGERFRLFNGSGVLKEEKVFTVTGVAAAGSTTVTFTPAAAATTASGDIAKLIDSGVYSDEAALDAALTAISGTSYTAARLASMTQNDKIYAIRTHLEPDSI